MIRSEQSLLQYLDSLLDLKGCNYLQLLRRQTRLNLQVLLQETFAYQICLRRSTPYTELQNLKIETMVETSPDVKAYQMFGYPELPPAYDCLDGFLVASSHTTLVQAELYNLTSVGGPRYVPRSVNSAAFKALDALFPMGQRSRRVVSLFFRLWFHPTEWPRQAYMASRSSILLTLSSARFTYR